MRYSIARPVPYGADGRTAIYSSDSYAASQALAKTLRSAGSSGIAFDSVRREDGACAAVFRPRHLSNVRMERHLRYLWNGARISMVYESECLTKVGYRGTSLQA